jgi:light-regulated signal transduction histidine kinase (bacteriophytochrome)
VIGEQSVVVNCLPQVAKLSLRVRLAALALVIAALAVIIMGAATITEQQVTPLRRFISTIEREISRLKRIVREVLSFARPTQPKWQVLPTVALLNDVRDLMSAQFSKANIELIVEESADPTIQCDPDQLKQLLLNLVQNAADSIGECGKIVLRARIERESPRTLLQRCDSGSQRHWKRGTLEVQKRLFDPSYTTKPAGTGLGLSIMCVMCYFLLERHSVSPRLAGDSDEEASKEGCLGAGKLVAPSGDASRSRSRLVVRQVFDSPFPARSTLFSHWTLLSMQSFSSRLCFGSN